MAGYLQKVESEGFGDFFLKDKYILIKAPFISEPELWAGFLEELLNIKLDVKTANPPFVFEIKEEKKIP